MILAPPSPRFSRHVDHCDRRPSTQRLHGHRSQQSRSSLAILVPQANGPGAPTPLRQNRCRCQHANRASFGTKPANGIQPSTKWRKCLGYESCMKPLARGPCPPFSPSYLTIVHNVEVTHDGAQRSCATSHVRRCEDTTGNSGPAQRCSQRCSQRRTKHGGIAGAQQSAVPLW